MIIGMVQIKGITSMVEYTHYSHMRGPSIKVSPNVTLYTYLSSIDVTFFKWLLILPYYDN